MFHLRCLSSLVLQDSALDSTRTGSHILKCRPDYFYLEANSTNPDQPAPNGAVWSGFILFAIKAAKIYHQIRKQTTLAELWMVRKCIQIQGKRGSIYSKWYDISPVSTVWIQIRPKKIGYRLSASDKTCRQLGNRVNYYKTCRQLGERVNYYKTCPQQGERVKGDSNPNGKYVISEKALWTMNFDTSIIKIGRKMGKLWAFKELNMANI